MRTSSSQAEGAIREFQVATLEFVGDEDGNLIGVKCCQVDDRRKPIAGTEFIIKADLAFIAIEAKREPALRLPAIFAPEADADQFGSTHSLSCE